MRTQRQSEMVKRKRVWPQRCFLYFLNAQLVSFRTHLARELTKSQFFFRVCCLPYLQIKNLYIFAYRRFSKIHYNVRWYSGELYLNGELLYFREQQKRD